MEAVCLSETSVNVYQTTRCHKCEDTILPETMFAIFLWHLKTSDSMSKKKNPSMASVHERTIPTERLPLVADISANILPDRGCRVLSATDPHCHILNFLDRSHYYVFQVAPQLYSRGWVDPVPDPLLLRKSGSAGNRTWDFWICRQTTDHRGGPDSMSQDHSLRHPQMLHSCFERGTLAASTYLTAYSKSLERIWYSFGPYNFVHERVIQFPLELCHT
jgi:hypothetical protein